MAYCHQRRLAHRDLKPDNILLEAGTRRVKIGDFGLAKTMKESLQSVTRGVGSPVYMAPELFLDDEELQRLGCDQRSNILALDTYALGILIWQLWHKQQPFSKKGVTKIMRMVAKELRPSPDPKLQVHSVAAPRDLAKLWSALWLQDPAARPSVTEAQRLFANAATPAVLKSKGDIGAGPFSPAATTLAPWLERYKGLERYAKPLAQLGFVDARPLGEEGARAMLTDGCLANVVGMSSVDVRAFRQACADMTGGQPGGYSHEAGQHETFGGAEELGAASGVDSAVATMHI
jgi:hypothetical protein